MVAFRRCITPLTTLLALFLLAAMNLRSSFLPLYDSSTYHESVVQAPGAADKSREERGEERSPSQPSETNYRTIHCYEKLVEYLRPLQKKWQTRKEPILSSMVPSTRNSGTQQLRIVFILNHLTTGVPGLGQKHQQKVYRSFSEASWICHTSKPEQEVETVLARVVGLDDWSKTLTLECPPDSRSISFSMMPNTTSYTQQPTYDLTRLLECEQMVPPLFPQRHVELMACTMIRDIPSYELRQWIEYHRLIGFQHFVIYLHQPFSSKSTLPSLPYVTYVPWDFDMRKSNNRRIAFFHQQAQQTDCVYRAAHANVTWLALTDVDEYIQIRRFNFSSQKSLLEHLYDTNYRGLSLANQFFGAKHPPKKNQSSPPQLLMDYVWSAPHSSGRKQRTKVVVHPASVDYINVHVVTLADAYPDPISSWKIRLVHYKTPSQGVYRTKYDKPVEPIYDDSLKREYRELLLQRLGEAAG